MGEVNEPQPSATADPAVSLPGSGYAGGFSAGARAAARSPMTASM